MKKKTINRVILFSSIALLGIIVAQIFWAQKILDMQNQQIAIQETQVEILDKQFDQRVTIALTNVRDKLLRLTEGDYFLDPVKQITDNYYVVSTIETLQPEILEVYLLEEFKHHSILTDFEYGIYDCFTDSIIYDNYVALGSGGQTKKATTAPQLKWNHDGHYFGVFFPNRTTFTIQHTDNLPLSLILSTGILVIVILIFGYAIGIIIKQKRLSEVKNDFINNMTHELKTPISTISLSSEVLLKIDNQAENERVHKYAQIIFNENNRLKNQVERVLQLAKLDKDHIHLNQSEIDIHRTISVSADSFNLTLQENNGAIGQRLNAEKAVVYGDSVHITNIIYNLLDNAIKYSADAPSIVIETCNKNNGIEIAIIDSGIGISKENQKNIFEKFFRVSTGNRHDVKGFGLGLYYVKLIIEQHGGSIGVKSELSKGSRFTIWLPFNKD